MNEPVAIPGFSDLRLIGRGGFSTVYRARQDRLDRDIALKVLHVDAADEPARQQFHNECAAAGRLANHPNIVTVYDSGFTPAGEPYLVMEFCEGGSLADRIRGGPLDAPASVTVLVKLAGALAVAHQSGILHRDIKPENVLFTSYGEPALADFGVASLTSGAQKSFTVAALTPNHAAPEVLDGRRASVGSDVYSLASTGYQILTGAPPFQRGRDEGLLSFFGRIVAQPAPRLVRPDVPTALTDALARGLAKSPGERFASAEEFGGALRGAVPAAAAVASSAEVVIAPPPPPTVTPLVPAEGNVTMLRPGGRPVPPAAAPGADAATAERRRRLVPLLVGIVLLLLLGAAGAFMVFTRKAPAEAAGAGATTTSTRPGAPSSTPTPPTTPSPTPGAPTTAAAAGGGGNTEPTGPRIDIFRITEGPNCGSTGPGGPFPAHGPTLTWKISGGATGAELYMDGGLYDSYPIQGSATPSFGCDGSPGEKVTHTYVIKTVGGGPQKARTLSATATVN